MFIYLACIIKNVDNKIMRILTCRITWTVSSATIKPKFLRNLQVQVPGTTGQRCQQWVHQYTSTAVTTTPDREKQHAAPTSYSNKHIFQWLCTRYVLYSSARYAYLRFCNQRRWTGLLVHIIIQNGRKHIHHLLALQLYDKYAIYVWKSPSSVYYSTSDRTLYIIIQNGRKLINHLALALPLHDKFTILYCRRFQNFGLIDK